LADEEPWKMIKTDEGVQTQMYVALQIAAALSSLCRPFFLYSKKIIKNFKIEVRCWSTIFQILI
jgi:methionyl-tRNA synthetase